MPVSNVQRSNLYKYTRMTSVLQGPTAILALNSLDRYAQPIKIYTGGGGVPPTLSVIAPSQNNWLLALYNNSYLTNYYPFYNPNPPGPQPTSANFSLNNGGALIYGYIRSISVSQVQMQYAIPTVVPSNKIFSDTANLSWYPPRRGNDTLCFILPETQTAYTVTIPYGFYLPEELSAITQTAIHLQCPLLQQMTVTYDNGFIFKTNTTAFYFPNQNELVGQGFQFNLDQVLVVLKTYRLFGLNILNSYFPYGEVGEVNTIFTTTPNFLYTPYIDIVSQNLTKFQKIKDTDTAPNKLNSIVSRVYLSGVGNPQHTSSLDSLGCIPFTITADMNTPKIIRWSPDETVYNLDFQMLDFYGDPIYWDANFPTEFQMTLLCAEGE